MKYSKEDIADATKRLTEWLKPGDTVYTVVKKVSASGMSRHISCYIVRKGEIYDITYYVGVLLGERRSPDTEGLVISGCGMDMGFHTVHALSHRLFPNGFKCVGSKCPSNDHFNDYNCRRDTFKGKKHKVGGGYALNQGWL